MKGVECRHLLYIILVTFQASSTSVQYCIAFFLGYCLGRIETLIAFCDVGEGRGILYSRGASLRPLLLCFFFRGQILVNLFKPLFSQGFCCRLKFTPTPLKVILSKSYNPAMLSQQRQRGVPTSMFLRRFLSLVGASSIRSTISPGMTCFTSLSLLEIPPAFSR